MPSTRSYWYVFLLLLAISILGTLTMHRSDGRSPEYVTPPSPQPGDVRVKQLEIAQTEAPSGTNAAEHASLSRFQGPVRIEAGSEGDLFVVEDRKEYEVINEVAPSGEVLHVFDGDSDPRMSSVTDLVIRLDRVWVANLLDRSIHELDRTTGQWTTRKLVHEPYRLEASIRDSGRLLMMQVGTPWMFDVLAPSGDIVDSFGEILERQEESSLLLDGYLTRSGESLVVAAKYLGIVISFSEHGDLNYVARMIDPPKPAVLMERDGMRWVRHEPLVAALSIGATEDTICVLSRRLHGTAIRSLIDLYETATGRYLGSLLLPAGEKWTAVAVGGRSVYVSSDRQIARWPSEVLYGHERSGSLPNGISIVRVKPVEMEEPHQELTRQKSPGISTG